MEKIDAASPESRSADILAENIRKLKVLFPELVTEGPEGASINVDTLKALVGDRILTDCDEKYGLTWFGKRAAKELALSPSTGTLRPCPEDSVDWDTTRNLMIEGDNLEVLKLLQKSYAGKVKLIYIDPPYNTGKDFVYPDNYQDNIKNYLELTGQIEGGRKMEANTETSGRFHTDWLNMMYPRLKLAKNLLMKEGFFIASIDDSELANLRPILNDIFGEENFVAVLVFDRNRKNDAKLFSVGHEYMVVYARDKGLLAEKNVRLRVKKEGLEEIREEFEHLKGLHHDNWEKVAQGLKEYYSTFDEEDPRLPLTRYTKVDARGPYRTDGNPSWPGGGGPKYDVLHPVTGKPCKIPSRGWVWPTYDRMKEEIDKGNVVFGPDETTIPGVRTTLFESDEQVMRSVIFSYAQKASQDFAKLFDGERVFDNPKSYLDLERLVNYLSEPGDIVLDYFAGSGTTAHSVMLANRASEAERRFILVQLPEPLDLNNKDQKVAAEYCSKLGKPLTIAEITKERLRRAGKKIAEGNPLFKGDLGFRVFKLDSSNIRAWDPRPADLETALLDSVEHIKPGRSESDLLFELLLKLGLDLATPIVTKSIAGKQVHAIGSGSLFACLADHVSRDEAEVLALGIKAWRQKLNPTGEVTCVFRDSGFEDNVAKTNLSAILLQHGIGTVRSI